MAIEIFIESERGTEGQRNRGTEGQRDRGTGGQRDRGTEKTFEMFFNRNV